MKTCDYLDELQSKLNIQSDYGLAKSLGISKQAISKYRNGRGSFDDQIAARVASALGLHPGIVLLDMYAERTKNESTRNIWQEISAGFPALLLLANSSKGFSPAW